MSNIKIQMKNISKVFETDELETHALKNIDITINAGDYVSIAGPSGCG
jgi:putative ABC transport system ATP-binding protein